MEDEANLARQRQEEASMKAAENAKKALRASRALPDRRKVVLMWWEPVLKALSAEVSRAAEGLELWRQAETEMNDVDRAIGKQEKVQRFVKFVEAPDRAKSVDPSDDFPDGWGDVATDLSNAFLGFDGVFAVSLGDMLTTAKLSTSTGPEQYRWGLARAKAGISNGRELFKAMGGNPADLKDFGLLHRAEMSTARRYGKRHRRR